jgi:hypothetical protein
MDEVFDARFMLAGSQIVGNTISADLLDYAARDFVMSGIDKRYDEEFLKYVLITDFESRATTSFLALAARKSGETSGLFTVLVTDDLVPNISQNISHIPSPARIKLMAMAAVQNCESNK